MFLALDEPTPRMPRHLKTDLVTLALRGKQGTVHSNPSTPEVCTVHPLYSRYHADLPSCPPPTASFSSEECHHAPNCFSFGQASFMTGSMMLTRGLLPRFSSFFFPPFFICIGHGSGNWKTNRVLALQGGGQGARDTQAMKGQCPHLAASCSQRPGPG